MATLLWYILVYFKRRIDFYYTLKVKVIDDDNTRDNIIVLAISRVVNESDDKQMKCFPSNHIPCSDKIRNNHKIIQHTPHMKSDTRFQCRNNQECIWKSQDKTRHNIRKRPTAPLRSREPPGCKTIYRHWNTLHWNKQFK